VIRERAVERAADIDRRRWQRRAGSGIVALSFFVAAPRGADAAPRALPREATERLRAALVPLEAGRLEALTVSQHDAVARICERSPDGACYELQLRDPEPSCAGTISGAWCVRWSSEAVSLRLRDEVSLALAGSPSSWITDTTTLPPKGAEGLERDGTDSGRWTDRDAGLLATFLVVFPLVCGGAAGRWLRRAPVIWSVGLAVAALLPMPVAAWVTLPRVSAWDVLLFGVLLVAGGALGRARIERGQAALLASSMLLSLAGLEIASRILFRGTPTFPPPREARSVFSPRSWDGSCTILYAPDQAETLLAPMHEELPLPPPDGRPLVAHFGDSMTFGSGVRRAESFVSLLGEREPSLEHRNYGVSNVGTDYEYLLFRGLGTQHRFAAVVLYVYVGNDLHDLDRPYECCEVGPLLRYEPAGPSARCPTARWGLTTKMWLAQSPAPYVFRVATAVSATARQVVSVVPRIGQALRGPPQALRADGEVSEAAWSHFDAILGAWALELREKDIPFTVVVLPHRDALEKDGSNHPARRIRQGVVERTARLHVSLLDSWDVFGKAVDQDGTDRYFLRIGGRKDIHFSPEGHRLLAGWLAERLSRPAGQ
jgi:hypothetical protein